MVSGAVNPIQGEVEFLGSTFCNCFPLWETLKKYRDYVLLLVSPLGDMMKLWEVLVFSLWETV
jgi:hypothetical protein